MKNTKLKIFLTIIVIILFSSFFSVLNPTTLSAGVNQWTSNGPSGSVINALGISPNYQNDNTLFGVTNSGEAYKSTNGGTSWSPINNGLESINSLPIMSLAISANYSNDNTVYIGTLSGGVYKTIDGGASWVKFNNGLSNNSIISLAISPNFSIDNTIFAGTGGGGVNKSINGGTLWSPINNGLSGGAVYSLAVSPNFSTDNTLFAGTAGGIFKSVNGGASWVATNSGLATFDIRSIAVSPNFSSNNTLFLGTSGSGVYKSTDGGGSWNQANNGLEIIYIRSLAFSPAFSTDNTIFVGTVGGGVAKSTNGGASWSEMNYGLPNNKIVHSISLSPNYASDSSIFAGTSGGGIFSFTQNSVSPNPPTAIIDSILPNPVTLGQNVGFIGHGIDSDGSIVAYNWRSSLDGQLSTEPSLNTAGLSLGTHTIYFKVQDNGGGWSLESSAEIIVTTLPIPPPPGTSPVYRFWSESKQSHFYTISLQEKNRVIATWPTIWSFEGVAYNAYDSQASGTSPVYRFWSEAKQGHFYTISPQERDRVIATWPTIWKYEGIAFYTYTTLTPGSSAVYRFWSESKQHHFYTNSLPEKDNVIATWPTIWSYEGIAYYAK